MTLLIYKFIIKIPYKFWLKVIFQTSQGLSCYLGGWQDKILFHLPHISIKKNKKTRESYFRRGCSQKALAFTRIPRYSIPRQIVFSVCVCLQSNFPTV